MAPRRRAGSAPRQTGPPPREPVIGKTSVLFPGGPVACPAGIAINPANDGVWVGDYGWVGSGTAANDLLILPNGKVKAVYTDATTHGVASLTGVWSQGVSASDKKILSITVRRAPAPAPAAATWCG
jgi:hypothetical protein